MRALTLAASKPFAPGVSGACALVSTWFSRILFTVLTGVWATSVLGASPSDDFASAKREAIGARNREPAYAANVGQVYDRQANVWVSKCVVAERITEHIAERKGVLALDFVIRIVPSGSVASVIGATDDPVYACIASSLASVPFPAHPGGDFPFFVGVDIRIPKPLVLH